MTRTRSSRVGAMASAGLIGAGTVLLLLVLEGVSSITLVLRDMLSGPRVVAERLHTRHDVELGWVAIPNVTIRDMYGAGRHLRTNDQGFRHDGHVPRAVPVGRRRVICSGDSFTFGYGVANEQTWCARLAALDARLETVNMGQGGYGVDQAYLWYMRDGRTLERDLHLFAVVTVDFSRMAQKRFLGYDKPVLTLEDGRLTTTNVPVPRRSPAMLRLGRTVGLAGNLSSIRMLRGLVQRWRVPPTPPAPSDPIAGVTRRVLDTLVGENAAKGSSSVVVYLPMEGDYEGHDSDAWRQALGAWARDADWHFVDLVEEVRALTPDEMDGVFIPKGVIPFESAAGHYTARGNALIARLLHRALLSIDPVARRLGATDPEP